MEEVGDTGEVGAQAGENQRRRVKILQKPKWKGKPVRKKHRGAVE